LSSSLIQEVLFKPQLPDLAAQCSYLQLEFVALSLLRGLMGVFH